MNFDQLQRNIIANGYIDRIRSLRAAILDKAELSSLCVDADENDHGSMFIPAAAGTPQPFLDN